MITLTIFSILKILIIDIICCFFLSNCSFLNYLAIRSNYYIFIKMRTYRVFIDTCVKIFRKFFDYFEYRKFLSSILILENLNKYSKLTTLFIPKQRIIKSNKIKKNTRQNTKRKIEQTEEKTRQNRKQSNKKSNRTSQTKQDREQKE